HRALSRSPVVDRHDPVFEDARLEPLLDQADNALVADPVLQEADQPSLANRTEEVLDVGVKYPVHLSPVDRYRKGVQRIVWTSSRPKPVRISTEVAFIDGVEHQDGCALDNLVFQGSYRQRPLLSVRLWYIRPAGWLRSVGSPMDRWTRPCRSSSLSSRSAS